MSFMPWKTVHAPISRPNPDTSPCRVSDPNEKRRPAGAASKSNGRADQDHDADTHSVSARDADFDGQPARPITWTDADVARLLAFMAECEQEERS